MPQTLEIALERRQEFPTSRRLSTDLRFIRRIRQGHVVPKSCKDIILDDAQKRDLMFQSSDNEIKIFGSGELLIHATSTNRICIDGTFSRCPKRTINCLLVMQFVPTALHFRSLSRCSKTKRQKLTRQSSTKSIERPHHSAERSCSLETILSFLATSRKVF